MSHILEVRDLHAWYGSSHILRGIDLQLAKAETVGLLGRNGMGKTTLLRSLMGHMAQKEGVIKFFGHDTIAMAPHQIARLGVAYVPEGRGIFPNLTVYENLVMAARSGKNDRMDWTYERVLETFPRLTERIKNLGSQLSGGEQQMLSIGRALMTNPDLIILDEATEGLAPLIVAEIWKVIAEIKTSGIASIIVDRDWHKVLSLSDQAIIMQKGQIVLNGSSKALIENPQLTQYLGI